MSGKDCEEFSLARSSRAKSRDAAQRFAKTLFTLAPSNTRIGLAVSGGPDSLALLLLAHEAIHGGFEVATVDHGLRPESAAEAQSVATVCDRLGIPHTTLAVQVAPTGNLQANARAARYAALGAWANTRNLGAIVTAHHADDQAETLLMRLARGAGARGLAGMRSASPVPGHPGLALLRPLLGWRKAELAAIVVRAGIDPVRDPSNADLRFERAQVRARLAAAPWLDLLALAASAAHLGEADAALDWAAVREWDEQVTQGEARLSYCPTAPRAIRLRVLERIIAVLGHEGTPRGAAIARLDDALSAGRIATLGGVRAQPKADGWWFTPAPPRKPPAAD